ncbi:MAG TPA: response regulator [Bacteroidales bacterium]
MKKILVVEDDDINYLVLEEILSEFELTLVRAADGREFYEIINKSKNFDLILMDLMLPDTDGIELSKYLIDQAFKIPIVVISAYTERCEEIFDLGIEYFISKPIYKDLFFSILSKFVTLEKRVTQDGFFDDKRLYDDQERYF